MILKLQNSQASGVVQDGGKKRSIDVDALRNDLANDCYGAFFGGGFGGAMIEAADISQASDEEVVRIAQQKGIDLGKYEVS